MIKKIFLSLSLLIGTSAIAQQGTASPYSFYGMGDINSNGTNEFKAMGGVSVYSDSIHMNLKNPASLSRLKLTTFSLGTTFKYYDLKSENETENAKRAAIDYITVGIPLGKLGVSFGLMPHSSVGYKIMTTKSVGNQSHSTNFDGDGGVNKAFAGVAYSILPNLQVGADFGYHFGHTDQTALTFITDNGEGYLIPNGTREHQRADYSGFSLNTGLIYTAKINNHDWHFSATYSPETKTTTDLTTTLEIVGIDSSIKDRKTTEVLSHKNINPSRISLGTGFGKDQKWFVGAEFTHTQNSKLNKNLGYLESVSFENSQRYAIGGFYIPKHNSFTSYFDRIVYRGGLRYENTGLIVANQSINDYAVSLGAGFPIGRNLTNLNVGLEYGQKGTNKNNLIKENYFNFSVGISLNDLWFVKRRFE